MRFLFAFCLVCWFSIAPAQDITDVLNEQDGGVNSNSGVPVGFESVEAGIKLIEENKIDDGIAEIRKAVAADPNNLDYRAALCEALAIKGNADEVWTAFRDAQAINRTHPAVAGCLLSAWQTHASKGLFNVGTPSNEVMSKLGIGDRTEHHGEQERWLYAFMAVNLVNDKVHSVMDLRLLDADVLNTTEKIQFRADGRKWRAVHRRVSAIETVTDYVLPNQDLSNWKELFSVQRMLGLSQRLVKPADYLESVRRDVTSSSNDAQFNVVHQDPARIVYEWHVPKTEDEPARHEVAQVFAGEQDLYRVAYSTRANEMTAEKRRLWIKLVAAAKVSVPRSKNSTSPGKPSWDLIVWELGGSLGQAGVLHAKRAHSYDIVRQFDKARILSQSFDVTLDALPKRSENAEENRTSAIKYVLRTAGLPLNRKIREKHGDRAAMLFEISSKANLLVGVYEPGDSKGVAVAEAIRRAGPKSELPESFWKPLVDSIVAEANKREIDLLVKQMQRNVREYLAK